MTDDSVRAREAILSRVRSATEGRDSTDHPDLFDGWRPRSSAESSADDFDGALQAVGGEVVRVPDRAEAAAWIGRFSENYSGVTCGRFVPDDLTPPGERAEPHDAGLAISMARGAVSETGSLILDARDGRRTQLLAPTHVVVVRADRIHETLAGALITLRDDLPSAIGLHSGPSKSADIGQILVKGVHGPGRLIALIVDEWRESDTSDHDGPEK